MVNLSGVNSSRDAVARSLEPLRARVPETQNSLQEASLWHEAGERIKTRTASGLRAIVIGFDPEARQHLLSKLREIGVVQTASISDVCALEGSTEITRPFDIIVVNFDAFGDPVDAVDALVEFRKSLQNKRVILISAQVKGDDFGSERKAICDATLRSPVTNERLNSAIRN